MIVGILTLVIIKSIPFFGWLICLAAIWWAWGAMIKIKKESLE